MSKIEIASMPATVPVRLAKYLIAQKMAELVKGTDEYNSAVALVKSTFNAMSASEVVRAGFNKTYLGELRPYGTVFMYVSELKKQAKKLITNNPRFSKDEADVLYASVLFLGRDTVVNAHLDKIISVSNKIDPKFGAQIAEIADASSNGLNIIKNDSSPKKMYDELRDIVKQATGKVGIKIPQEVITKLKAGNQKQATLAANYAAIRRKLTIKYDAAFAGYIAKQSKPPYVHEAYAAMAKLGFETQRLIKTDGKKVPLKVNVAAGKIVYLTEDGREIDGGIPPDAIEIKFMKTYDPGSGTGAYLSYTTENAAGVTRKYTTAHKQDAGKKKFDKADMVAENISRYVTKWSRDLSNRDDTIAMAATVCMLIYKTGMRVGSQVGSRSISGEKAYGALTLLNKQVVISGNKITLKYVAKKQVPQTNVILIKDKVDKILLRNIKEFKQGKGPDELIFATENLKGVMKRLLPQQLNTYLKTMGYTAGIHKIRHVRGTNLAIELLNSKPWRPTKEENKTLAKRQASAEAYIKGKILEPVADLLGHKSKDGKALWSTSISNYLNPKPFIKWFNDNGLRVPKWVPKTSN